MTDSLNTGTGIVVRGVSGATGNKVQIDGGTLNVVSAGSSTPAINIQKGALILNSGSVTTEVLLANTDATSVVTFNGGTLTTSNTTISNGAVFTVGDGTAAAALILNGGNHTFANGLTISNNATLSGTGTITATGNINYTGSRSIFNGAIAGSGNTLTLNNAATVLTLGGTSSYTGGTTVSAGTLVATSASALGTGAVTVAANAGLTYNAASDTALALGSTLAFSGASTLGGAIGATGGVGTSSAQITTAGNATSTTGALTVNVYGLLGTTPSTGTYTLLHGGGAANTLNNFTSIGLGTVFNNTNWKITGGSLAKSASDITVGITSATALTSAFWKGTAVAGITKVWAASDGNATGNWASTSGGALQGLIPTAVDVTIGTTTVAATNSTLGADMTIKSLTVTDTSNGLSLNADGHTLTITPATSFGSGITVGLGVPTSTIAANVALGQNQIWQNGSANPLTISGIVSGGFGLWKQGSGTITLSGANTFTGGITVLGGVLNIQNATATGTTAGGVDVRSGFALQIQNDITVGAEALTLNGTGVSGTGALRNMSGNNTWQGTVTLASAAQINSDAGSLTFTRAANSITGTQNLTLGGAGNGTVGGTITTGTGTLTKAGAGTWTLSAANTYTGATTVTAGTLVLSGGGVIGNGAVAVNGGQFTVNGAVGNGGVTVASGAILGGSGTIAGAVSIANGGTLAPGNSPGTLTVASSIWNDGGNYNWQLYNATGSAGSAYDTIASSGNLNLSSLTAGGFKINLWTIDGLSSTSGSATNFDSNGAYSWSLGSFGTITGFDASKFTINTSATNGTTGFANSFMAGGFKVSTNGSGQLLLTYQGASPVWTGGSGNLSTIGTTNGSALVFTGSGGNVTNNAQVSSLSSMTFSNTAGATTFSGSALTNGNGGIVNNSTATQTVSLPLTLGANQSFDAASGNLAISGNVANNGNTLTLAGASNTTVSGDITGNGGLSKTNAGTATLSGNNTYSGAST
ncbi:MAG: autotransporter-associated beta strand repeat-containing protein, partial [bacterium]